MAKAANAGGGVLLSYGNYAGDVLHFGQAQLRLNAEGIETRTVLVTDDIASAPLDQIEKRRGIAGDLTVFKIAGAAAEAGLDLDDVERLAIRTNYRTRSLGVAFDGCTLPGADAPLFPSPRGRCPWAWASTANRAFPITPCPRPRNWPNCWSLSSSPTSPTTPAAASWRSSTASAPSSTTSCSCCSEKSKSFSLAAGLTVVEPECGELVTSLDMSGLSLTLLWLDDELEQYWAAPADTPAFRKGNLAPRARARTGRRGRGSGRPPSNAPPRPRQSSDGRRPQCSARSGTSSSNMRRNWAGWTPSPATATTASGCAAAWTQRSPLPSRRPRPTAAPRRRAS